jgi:hypothetical protein
MLNGNIVVGGFGDFSGNGEIRSGRELPEGGVEAERRVGEMVVLSKKRKCKISRVRGIH